MLHTEDKLIFFIKISSSHVQHFFSFVASVSRLLLLALTCIVTPCLSQNHIDFFKSTPHIHEDTRQWARMMYGEDPDVREVDRLYYLYKNSEEYLKDTDVRNYLKWRRDIAPYINDDGRIRLPNQKEQEAYIKKMAAKSARGQKSAEKWRSIGPFETYRSGTTTPLSNHAHMNAVDRSLSDSTFVMGASATGGLFRSTDRGLNWELVSKDLPFNGTSTIQIHPTSTDTIWAAANNRLYRSDDKGDTWTAKLVVGSNAYEFKYDPNDHSIIYAVGAFGCYRTADGGDSWSQIVSATTWDLDFRPSSSDTIYMLSEQSDSLRAIFLRSIDAGQSWDTITAGWYRPEDMQHASAGGGKIAVTPADPNRVYVGLIGASKGGDNGWIGVYKSTDSGTSFTLPQGQTGGPYDTYGDPEGVWSVSSYKSGYHQGFYNYDLEVSHTDPEKLWVGTVLLSESTDGGRRWCQINGGSCKRITQHADVQDIDVYGDEIWTASDGGIDFSPDEYLTNESRKRGIIGSDFWGFDTGWNTDILVGGKYHNGNTAWYESYTEGITHYVGGVEEFTGYVHPQIDRKAYFNQYWSNNRMNTMLIPRVIGANTESQQWATVIPNEGYPGESSGYVFHPVYSDRIFIGKDSTIQRSDDGGLTWRVLEGFDFGSGYVTEIEISRSNPDVMYAGYKIANTFWTNQDIYRSDDGGENWTKVTRPPFSQYYTGKRVAISLNPWDEDDIIVGMWFEFNGKKVYRSQDGGQSWNNITPSMIDDQKIADVYYQAGVDSSSIYVSTNEGVYRYTTESGTWHDFSSGLPTIAKGMRLRPFYKKSKLRMSSEGRGIWEAPLAGDFRLQALPMTLSDTLRCSRDTVFLDSYSIVNQTDVSWLWEITPMPRYVSDATSRAPKVLLDDGISYDVKLTVTDAAGVTNSRTISDMLYMKSECEVDSVAGRALQPWASGQYATATGIGYSGAAYSVSMWVKPSADHPSTAFLWSNGGDGDLVGVNFAGAGDDLRIHHAGRRSTWAIHTDLKAPADAWTHVVLVSDPEAEELRLYANGVPFTYSSNEIGDYDFETLLIGVQRNWSSRWFKGRIDEVKLYNRALSTDEVRMMRHMIADPSADQSLIGYWQCNERTGQIIDRAGIAHATSFAARTSSTAPVGVGKSELRSFMTHGTYLSESTGIDVTFFENDHPNGDMVFNLLYDLPHNGIDDTEGLGSYWIVNNYGDVVDSFSLSLNFNAATSEAIPPRIYNRSDNGDQSDWTGLERGVFEDDTSPNGYRFLLSSENLGQLFLNAECLPGEVIQTYYRDHDEDGYGDALDSLIACVQPVGYVLNAADCMDDDDAVHPLATEICNGIDDDCNGLIDDGLTCSEPCETIVVADQLYVDNMGALLIIQADSLIRTDAHFVDGRSYQLHARQEVWLLPGSEVESSTQVTIEMVGCED